MRLPALRLAFLRGLTPEKTIRALGDLLLGTVLVLPADLPDAEREEICDVVAFFVDRPVHVAARPVDLPDSRVCVITEPVEGAVARVGDGVVIAVRAVEAGRRRLGLPRELRRLRDFVLQAIGEAAVEVRHQQIAGWAQIVGDSPSTALRFASAAHRESLASPLATDAELVVEGLAETIGWLLHGVDTRVAEWVLARAVPSKNAGRLVSTEAALLGETAAMQRALAAGLVEHLPERPDDPEDVLDLRRPIALLGELGDLPARVELGAIAAALRTRLDPAAHRVFERLLRERPKPLRLGPPLAPPLFASRDEVIARLTVLFEPAREVRTAVLCGVGGIGKSAVAVTLCERLADRLEPVWLTFADGPEGAWQRVADGLGVETTGKPRDQWLRRVHGAMAERDALLVVDDVDGVSESELPTWLPSGAGTCAVLVLSRQPQRVLQREHDAILVSLRGATAKEARELLARMAPALVEAIGRGEADALLRQLDGHPAALRMAAGLLEKQSIAEVTALLKRGDDAIRSLARPALAALDAEEKAVVEALAVAAMTGSPVGLVARMVGKEDVGPVLRRLAERALVELGARTVRLLGVVRLAVEGGLEEVRRGVLEVEHARAAGAVMGVAREGRDEEGRDEAYADAMLALGRMTERCKKGEGELAEVVRSVANELQDYPRGPRGETLTFVVAGWRAVLGVWTRESRATDWANTQNRLGLTLANLPTGNRAENLEHAIDAYQAALTVSTRDGDPQAWAGVQSNLGNALASAPSGDRLENVRRAIEAHEAALTVYTEQADPEGWARTQSNLGSTLLNLLDGDQAANQRRAVEAFQAALRVYTPQSNPYGWATVQNNLGRGLAVLQDGDRAENLRRAIDAFEAALTVYTRRAYPERWAQTQSNLGAALANLPNGDRDDNVRRAIEAHQAALTVYTRDAYPWLWARTRYNLGVALMALPSGDRRQNLLNAIDAFRSALTVYTEDAFPTEHAQTHANLNAALTSLTFLDAPPP